MDIDDLIAIQVLEDLAEAEDDLENAREIRRLTKTDPFSLSQRLFLSMFRLSKELARNLIDTVTPLLRQATRQSALSVETKVFITLRFLATGSYQEITGSNHYVGVSQASVSRCIRDVCTALTTPQIFNHWVQFPRNIRELEALRRRFYEAYGFPGIVGVVDCTHVAITAPHTNDPEFPEHIYVNRKNYHSLNVQLVCDENLKIINVDASFPGSVHDSHIFRQSEVCEILEQTYRRHPENPLFLIGDSGYYLLPWLLTPLANPQTPGEVNFNNSFKSARSLIERCNGVLKNRFRCLLKHRVLHYAPQTAGLITNACVVLHNMCIEHTIPQPEEVEMEEVDFGVYINYVDNNDDEDNLNDIGINPDLRDARRLQQSIIHNNFV